MYKTVTILLVLLFSYPMISQNKSSFDINFNSNEKKIIAPLSMGNERVFVSNEKSSLTLLKDSYFTIGTTSGMSENKLDDSCQITFGHPYAKTSYPYFRINGSTKMPDTYFYGQVVTLEQIGEMLKVSALNDPNVGFIFSITENNDGKINAVVKVINKQSTPAIISAGIVFDPALGKWGDGFVYNNNTLLQKSISYTSDIPNRLDIWERNTSPKGVGCSLTFPDGLPDKIDIDNWFNIYLNQPSLQYALYDAGMKFEKTMTVASGDTLSFSLEISLQQPEFPQGIFIRSNLPSCFSIENNLLFPSEPEVLTEIYNNGSTSYSNLKLSFNGQQYLNDYLSTTSFQSMPGTKTYQLFKTSAYEIYEPIVVPLELKVTDNNVTVDNISRNLFVPGSPFSDTGLVIKMDTIIVNSPHVTLGFKGTIEETGVPLTALRKSNLFLYEDQQRIYNFALEKDTASNIEEADIVFVLDVTGSMSEEIDGVKNNIREFADSLSIRGINFRLGMVTFLDYIENKYDFTNNIQLFKSYIEAQSAHDGGDWAENSLDAIIAASNFNFRPSAKRIIIWITDATFHINNEITQQSIQSVVNTLLAKAITINGIGDLQYQTEYFDPLVLPTGGKMYNIYGNFRDIFMELSRMGEIRDYLVKYDSPGGNGPHELKMEIHYAGLGGSLTVNYQKSTSIHNGSGESISCYPNPFNPETNIVINNPELCSGEIEIFNILGQKIKSFSFNSGSNPILYKWNAANDMNRPAGNGIYFVRVSYFNPGSAARVLPVQKLIYLK